MASSFTRDELFDLEYAVKNLIDDKKDYCPNEEGTAEAVADDLATLDLDDEVANEEYRRTGFNPWALPREDSAGPERVN